MHCIDADHCLLSEVAFDLLIGEILNRSFAAITLCERSVT